MEDLRKFLDCENLSKIQLSSIDVVDRINSTDNCACAFSICNFKQYLKEPSKGIVTSSRFTLGKYNDLYINLVLHQSVDPNFLSLDLRFLNVPRNFKGNYTVSLFDINDKKFQIHTQNIRCKRGEFSSFSINTFLKIEDLKNPNCQWLNDSKLTILTNIAVIYEDLIASNVIDNLEFEIITLKKTLDKAINQETISDEKNVQIEKE